MIARGIEVEEVIEVIQSGELIAEYLYDKPHPSALLLKFVNNRPIHVVVAQNITTNECVLITCYLPDPALWDKEFKRKIK